MHVLGNLKIESAKASVFSIKPKFGSKPKCKSNNLLSNSFRFSGKTEVGKPKTSNLINYCFCTSVFTVKPKTARDGQKISRVILKCQVLLRFCSQRSFFRTEQCESPNESHSSVFVHPWSVSEELFDVIIKTKA